SRLYIIVYQIYEFVKYTLRSQVRVLPLLNIFITFKKFIYKMEPGTPKGIKILIAGTRKRIDDLRKYIGGNCQKTKTGRG
ncbi:hypothetical protein, partial [Treponema sp. R80B11-R83G3]